MAEKSLWPFIKIGLKNDAFLKATGWVWLKI